VTNLGTTIGRHSQARTASAQRRTHAKQWLFAARLVRFECRTDLNDIEWRNPITRLTNDPVTETGAGIPAGVGFAIPHRESNWSSPHVVQHAYLNARR